MRSPVCLIAVLILLTGSLLVSPGYAAEMSEVIPQFSGTGAAVVPYVTSTTHNSTFIRWYPRNVSPDTLFYANESHYIRTGSYDHTVIVNKTSPSPMIFLSDLEAGTRYHYTLQSDSQTTGNQSFMTFPQDGSCTFIVYGDTREQAPYFTQLERHKIVADRIAGESNISLVINTGDLVSNPDDPEEWNRFFTAGKMLYGTTTYAVVRGNHDSNLTLFGYLFGTDGIYSIDCGDIHVVVLDSTDYAGFSLSEQSRWLAEDLASAGKWNMVILHHPLYTSEENHFGGFENLQKEFEPVFLSENVSVVFNGHVHAYERIEQSGIQYVTEGRGGAPAYRLRETKMEGSVRSREHSLGYSRVSINPESGSLTIDAIQVAEVSPDLRNVTQIFPMDTVIDRIEFKKPGKQANPREIPSKSLPLPTGVFGCHNSSVFSKYDLSSIHIPFCILRGFPGKVKS